MSLKISVVDKGKGAFIIAAEGEIDSDTYKNLEAQLTAAIKQGARLLILNMEGVDYITSMGICVILKAKESIEKLGGTFIMTSLQPQIKKVFDIVNVLPTMKVFASVEEADRYFGRMQREEMGKGKKAG
ncbi:MAG: STAS domain-containing protein [Candidatus Omnitrophica bacterium]|nr:STAS domain-containing protein [Candidatus Omnitrophota bacterium]MCM8790477.1 STAS domain-containing protein [Candidatus Omnitrophota bacterium]